MFCPLYNPSQFAVVSGAISDQGSVFYNQATCFAPNEVARSLDTSVQVLPARSLGQAYLPVAHLAPSAASAQVVARPLSNLSANVNVAHLRPVVAHQPVPSSSARPCVTAPPEQRQPVCLSERSSHPVDESVLTAAQNASVGESSGTGDHDDDENSDEFLDEGEEDTDASTGSRPKVRLTSAQRGEAQQAINDVWITRTSHKKELLEHGVVFRSGRWSQAELELLSKNVNQFVLDNGFESPQEIIFDKPKDERKEFYRVVARGLDRQLFSVYRRVLRMYDKRNYVGKYSKDDIETLIRLHEEHGTKWSKIGKLMGRSASSVKDRFRLISKPHAQGRWADEEEDLLLRVVHEVSDTPLGQPVESNIKWLDVAKRIPSRSAKQCRAKWINYLSWKERKGSAWTRQHEIQLIEKLHKLNVEEETEIEWDKLAEGWDSVRSRQWLRTKWWTLKRHVPTSHAATFCDMVSYLRASYPELVQKKTRQPTGRQEEQEEGSAPTASSHADSQPAATLDVSRLAHVT